MSTYFRQEHRAQHEVYKKLAPTIQTSTKVQSSDRTVDPFDLFDKVKPRVDKCGV
jgi:hypothetical protein